MKLRLLSALEKVWIIGILTLMIYKAYRREYIGVVSFVGVLGMTTIRAVINRMKKTE